MPKKASDISRVLVIGAGTMGEGIAQHFAQAGLQVQLADIAPAMLERCEAQIKANLTLSEEFSLLKDDVETILGRISYAQINDGPDLGGGCGQVDFVVECVSENLDLKRELFVKLDALFPGVVLASNTSSLTISQISEGLGSPSRVVGLHYFYPAHIVPLVEIHGGKCTDAAALELCKDLMIRVGKRPIMVKKEIPGLIVNRIQAAYNREVTYLLEQGVASAEDLDMAAKASYGFRLSCLGPLQIHDLNGLDIVLKAGGKVRQTLYSGSESSPALIAKVEAGELGVKTGKGWHNYAGRSREEVLEECNRKLLRQLVTFQKQEEER